MFDETDEIAAGSTGGLGLAKRVAAATARLALATLFVVAGVMKLVPTEFEVNSFRHFGYALWFMYVIGAVELAGGLMLLVPSFAALGALAMMPVMVGAAFSHVMAGDPVGMAALRWCCWSSWVGLPMPAGPTSSEMTT